MANNLPVSDLRNYNEVLKNCHKGEPVYLTKNGEDVSLSWILKIMSVTVQRKSFS